jgi:hypothetical protein
MVAVFEKLQAFGFIHPAQVVVLQVPASVARGL